MADEPEDDLGTDEQEHQDTEAQQDEDEPETGTVKDRLSRLEGIVKSMKTRLKEHGIHF